MAANDYMKAHILKGFLFTTMPLILFKLSHLRYSRLPVTIDMARRLHVDEAGRLGISDHKIHETCHSVTFYFMKKLIF